MSIFCRNNVQVAHYLSTNCNMIIAERNFPLSCQEHKNRHNLNISLSAQWRSLKYTDHNIIVRRKHKATLWHEWVAWRTTLISEPWYVPYFLLCFWKDVKVAVGKCWGRSVACIRALMFVACGPRKQSYIVSLWLWRMSPSLCQPLSCISLQTDGRRPGGPEVAWECQGHGMWPVIDTC